MRKSGINRRVFLRMGLGAGAGLALWELSQRAFKDAGARSAAALMAFNETGLSQDEMGRILALALARGGEYADIFLEFSVSTRISFDQDRVKDVGVEVVSGGAVHLLADGRTSFHATEDLSYEGLAGAARAVAGPQAAGRGPGLPPLRRLEAPGLYDVAAPAAGEAFDSKQRLMLRMIEAARNADPRVLTTQATYRDSLRFIALATSTGVMAYDTQPTVEAHLTASAADERSGKSGVGNFNGGGHYGFEYFKAHPPESLGQAAAREALRQMEGVQAPSGEMPVVLGPGYSGVLLHEAVGHGLEADFNLLGYSTYANRLGETVASPLCTVSDNGRKHGLNGAINFDDEGVPSRDNMLIEGGRLAGYMHSRETASSMGAEPTGNGRRQGFGSPPLPRMTNTYLHAGDSDPEEIIRSVNYGIYARDFANGTVNTLTGDFNFTPTEAYLIEGGRITAPLLNVLLLGNGSEILKRISMVGHDLQFSDNLWDCGKMGQYVPVSVGTPTVKISSMTVGGSQEQ